MLLRRDSLLSFIITFFSPLIGALLSLFTYKRGHERSLFITLSMLAFAITYFIPPLQDLYRRYTLNYLPYSENTTYITAITGHVDILMYVILLFFKKNNIPFFWAPALEAAFAVYLGLSAVNTAIKEKQYKTKQNALIFFLSFLMINFVGIALGLRFGFAVSLFTYAAIKIIYKERFFISCIILLLSVCMHFSMLIPVAVLIGSIFCSVNKKITPVFCLLAYLAGAFVFFSLFNSIQLGNINDYAQAGYIDGKFANADTAGNAMIMSVFRFTFFFVLYSIYYFSKNIDSTIGEVRLEKFVNLMLITCFLMTVSFSAFSRYMNGVLLFFIFIYIMANFYISYRKITKLIIIFFIVLNFSLQYVYAQRRALIFGEMWRGLYTPVLYSLYYSNDDLKTYLKNIDADGDVSGYGYPSN
ncbi:hypothetical protein GZ061_02990 [Klebsiella oxytoca]|uniref:EpsG family protein n=1 Tax=Klebsiella oxytoca TaxID=571 RepID=UPI0019062C8B|nr:EpsG family protein [Klebsiella oxytoca]MBK0691037.1 hypothetical protein [Klebsiella oxytoca]